MEELTYCRVTFDDGSTNDYAASDFYVIWEAMKDMVGNPVLMLKDLVGAETAFFVRKLQDIYVSTPESRQLGRDFTKTLKEEKKLAGGWDDE